jgi:S-adenosylmethionine synthetase
MHFVIVKAPTILDAAIRVNPDAKVAMETATKSGMVIKKEF